MTNGQQKSDEDYTAEVEEEGGSVTIKGEISQTTLNNYRQPALENLQKNISLDGFRDNKIPESVLVDQVGEMGLLQEMARLAIQKIYPQIIANRKIQAIGRPEIQITKLSPDNPVEFSAQATTMPEVQLPDDYKKIAKQANKESGEGDEKSREATEEDVDEAIESLRQQWAQAQKYQEVGDDIDPREIEVGEEDLPVVDDEFVQQISDSKTVAEFRQTVKENIQNQNERKQTEAKRGRVIQAIADASTVDLPDLVIEGELDRMMAQFESDIARADMSLEDYFESTDTSKEELRKRWRPDATRRAKTQLVLNKIAAEEGIEAEDQEIEEEVEKITQNYEDISPARARSFVRAQLVNEKTIEFIEEQANK